MRDYEAVAEQYRIDSYRDDGLTIERPWKRLAPGAKNSWIRLVRIAIDSGALTEGNNDE